MNQLTADQEGAIAFCKKMGFPSLETSQLSPSEYLDTYYDKARIRRCEKHGAPKFDPRTMNVNQYVSKYFRRMTDKQEYIVDYCQKWSQPKLLTTNLSVYDYIGNYWEKAQMVHKRHSTSSRQSRSRRRHVDNTEYQLEDEYTSGMDYGDFC